jgi:hypothetical protein
MSDSTILILTILQVWRRVAIGWPEFMGTGMGQWDPPMLSSNFLAEFKRDTEARWLERPINPNGFQSQQDIVPEAGQQMK